MPVSRVNAPSGDTPYRSSFEGGRLYLYNHHEDVVAVYKVSLLSDDGNQTPITAKEMAKYIESLADPLIKQGVLGEGTQTLDLDLPDTKSGLAARTEVVALNYFVNGAQSQITLNKQAAQLAAKQLVQEDVSAIKLEELQAVERGLDNVFVPGQGLVESAHKRRQNFFQRDGNPDPNLVRAPFPSVDIAVDTPVGLNMQQLMQDRADSMYEAAIKLLQVIDASKNLLGGDRVPYPKDSIRGNPVAGRRMNFFAWQNTGLPPPNDAFLRPLPANEQMLNITSHQLLEEKPGNDAIRDRLKNAVEHGESHLQNYKGRLIFALKRAIADAGVPPPLKKVAIYEDAACTDGNSLGFAVPVQGEVSEKSIEKALDDLEAETYTGTRRGRGFECLDSDDRAFTSEFYPIDETFCETEGMFSKKVFKGRDMPSVLQRKHTLQGPPNRWATYLYTATGGRNKTLEYFSIRYPDLVVELRDDASRAQKTKEMAQQTAEFESQFYWEMLSDAEKAEVVSSDKQIVVTPIKISLTTNDYWQWTRGWEDEVEMTKEMKKATKKVSKEGKTKIILNDADKTQIKVVYKPAFFNFPVSNTTGMGHDTEVNHVNRQGFAQVKENLDVLFEQVVSRNRFLKHQDMKEAREAIFQAKALLKSAPAALENEPDKKKIEEFQSKMRDIGTKLNDFLKEKKIRIGTPEYQLLKKMRDICDLSSDVLSGKNYNDYKDVYALAARLNVLVFKMGDLTHFYCKSAKDRSGTLDAEAKKEILLATGNLDERFAPLSELNKKEEAQTMRRAAHLFLGNKNITTLNTAGVEGIKSLKKNLFTKGKVKGKDTLMAAYMSGTAEWNRIQAAT